MMFWSWGGGHSLSPFSQLGSQSCHFTWVICTRVRTDKHSCHTLCSLILILGVVIHNSVVFALKKKKSCNWECCFRSFVFAAESRQPEKKSPACPRFSWVLLDSPVYWWSLLSLLWRRTPHFSHCILKTLYIRFVCCGTELGTWGQCTLKTLCIRFVAVLAPSCSSLRIVKVSMWALLSCGNEWLQ